MKLLNITATLLTVASLSLAAPLRTEHSLHVGTPTLMDVNAGLLAGGGDALPGIDLKVRGRLNTASRLFLGGEVGMFFFSQFNASGVVLPLLGSFSAEFDLDSPVHPTIGVSAGPAISTGNAYTTARFMMLFDPGLIIDLDRRFALTALARLGVLGSSFVALPQLGLMFAI